MNMQGRNLLKEADLIAVPDDASGRSHEQLAAFR
jgi:hypothetical protein